MSPAPLSVVIPTLNAAGALGPTLGALAEGAGAGLIRELILSDGGSTDGVDAVAEAAGARLVTGPPGRGGQLARGAAAARGEWILFLHADTAPTGNWIQAIRAHMATRPAQAAAFRLRFDAPGPGARWTEGWANLRSRVFALPYGDQGLLISRALYESVGGYPDIPLMEDVALARRLGRRRLRLLEATALTGAERYLREGWARRGWRNLTCLALYCAGAPPERLALRYRRTGEDGDGERGETSGRA